MTSHDLKILDVQHGACALLTSTTDDGLVWRTLIDCGHMNNSRGRWYPGEYVRGQGAYVVDLLIITNLDEDHVSGLPNLLNQNISILHIFSNPTVPPWAIKLLKEQHGMGAGIESVVQELSRRGLESSLPWLPEVCVQCFWNQYPYPFEDENNLSVITSLRFHGLHFMFTGDMECNGFNHLLENCAALREAVKTVDVLVAPHHGRENGVCPALFDVYGCRPKLVVISDDYMQYDTQETSAFYRARATGYKFQGKDRWVLTTRSDGVLDFMSIGGALFAY